MSLRHHTRLPRANHLVRVTLVAFAVLTATARPADAQITAEQATAFGKQIDASMREGDIATLDKAIDMDAILKTATAGMNVPPGAMAGFKRGVQQVSLGTQIGQQVQAGGTYRFLRARGTPEKRTVLFRLAGNDGLNYHELHLAPDAATGEPRVVDIHVMLSGELMSATFRRLFLPIVAEANKGRVARLLKGEEDLIKHSGEIQQFTQLTRAGKPQEALAVYDALPQSIRNEKAFMILRLMNTAKVDDAQYQRAIAEYQKQFPNDPGGVLVGLDGLFLNKEYDKVLESIDALEKQIGGDPYLDLYRANAHISKGDNKKGKAYLAKLMKAEPTLAQTYYSMLDLTLAEQNWDETARLLTAAEQKANVRFDDLESAEVFAGFVKTPQYKKWKASRTPAAAPAPEE